MANLQGVLVAACSKRCKLADLAKHDPLVFAFECFSADGECRRVLIACVGGSARAGALPVRLQWTMLDVAEQGDVAEFTGFSLAFARRPRRSES